MTDEELKGLLEAMRQENAAAREETAAGFAAVQREFVAVRQETAAGFAAVRQESMAGFAAVRQESTAGFAAVWQEFAAVREENAAAHVETRRHFDNVIEDFDAKYERLAEAIQGVDEKSQRRDAALEERMEAGFAVTQSMIKYAYSDLDRRVRVLEGSGADL